MTRDSSQTYTYGILQISLSSDARVVSEDALTAEARTTDDAGSGSVRVIST